MAYQFNNITLDQIDSTGAVLFNINTFTAATIPALLNVFAIGNRIKLTLTIDASGADTFNNKSLRYNPGLFIPNTGAANAYLLGWESNGSLTNVLTACVPNFGNGTNLPARQNISCSMSVDAMFTTATIEFIFYVTYDIQQYAGISPQGINQLNINRFISAAATGTFTNSSQTVYRTNKNFGSVAYVFDSIGFGQHVLEPVGLNRFLNMPSLARWFNSDYSGFTTGMRYLAEIEITSPTQIGAGLPSLTLATAASAQSLPQTNILGTYNITNNQLALGEMNAVSILLSGDAYTGSVGNPAITDVRALLFRIDDVTNAIDFVSDLQLSDAVITAGTVAVAQIDGAIWSPCDWFEDVPNPDDIRIEFMIDGSMLTISGRYFIIVNIYDSVNTDYVTSHITPELTATYTPPAIPTITGYLSTYNKEYTGNELTVCPHQRIKATINIDKASYAAALLALGITGTFDGSLFGIICKLENITGVVNQVQGYIPNTLTPPLNNEILTPAMELITNDATDLRLECIFRLEEEYAGTNPEITWTITFNQPTATLGITQQVQVDYIQKLDVIVFENDAISPNLLAVRFYDADFYPATKIEIIDFCDVQQVIVEVEKDATFSGSINLIATIYPASESGNTTAAQIQEECEWAPVVIQMAQLVSGKLDAVETGFLGDDFATFRINCQQLALGQRYWVTAIAFQQIPDYCPIGLVAITTVSNSRSGTALPGWAILSNPSSVIAEILAHPDYVGGLNVVQNNFTDILNNQVGLYTNYVGYQVGTLAIDQSLGTVYYRLVIDAQFDSGSGTHTVRHTLEVAVNVPPIPNLPPVVGFNNAYECTDLG